MDYFAFYSLQEFYVTLTYFMWQNTEFINFKHLKRIVTYGLQKAKQILRHVYLEMQNISDIEDVIPNQAALPLHVTQGFFNTNLCVVRPTLCVRTQIDRGVPQCRCPLQSFFTTYSVFMKYTLFSRLWTLQLYVWNVTTYSLPKLYRRFGRTCLPFLRSFYPKTDAENSS